jgi:hypothetical protein
MKVGKEKKKMQVGAERAEAVLKKMSKFRLEHEVSGDTVFLYARDEQDLRGCYPMIEGENFFHRRASLEDVFLKLAGHELRD